MQTELDRRFDETLAEVTGPGGRVAIGRDPQGRAIVSNLPAVVAEVQAAVEACRYNVALQTIWLEILNPANKHVDDTKPWALFTMFSETRMPTPYSLVSPSRREPRFTASPITV